MQHAMQDRYTARHEHGGGRGVLKTCLVSSLLPFGLVTGRVVSRSLVAIREKGSVSFIYRRSQRSYLQTFAPRS